ncbi:sodium calcium [Cordyceps militaris]|uniref:Sodium calcium n=1 Tax=Cordyceps militaris TaxID=73501 RepID=A0A2H4SM09_CORMI|nr:sodium calcium [Cordyceps militaris]
MAAADTTRTASPTPNTDIPRDHDDQQQVTPPPSLDVRFSTPHIDETCHDVKTSSHRQPRGGLAQVLANAYHDILHSWMGLHRAFREPAAPCRRPRARSQQPHYDTFPYSSACDDAVCCSTPATNATAFSAAMGDMILEPYINGLLICVPLGISSYWAAAPSIVVFTVNALAIVPLSALLTDATERIALEAGDAVGAFLNISLGNIGELILFFTLMNGHVRIVQASILGSILVNLLPILGSALIATDTTGGDDSLRSTETQILACLLFVSVFVFMIPTAFRFTFNDAHRINDLVVDMSRASAILILVMYIAYFLHTLQSSHHIFSDDEEQDLPPPVTPPPLLRRPSPPLTPGPRTLRFADGAKTKPTSDLYARRIFEIGPASVDSDGGGGPEEQPPPPTPRGRSLTGTHGPHSAYTVSSPLLLPPHMRLYQSRSRSAGSSRSRASSGMSSRRRPRSFARAGLARVLSNDRQREEMADDDDDDTSGRLGTILASATVLLVASLLLAVSARLLAGTLDAVTRRRGVSGAVIGLVLLPLAGNLSGFLTVVAVAARDNLDLAVAVSAGSAIQVALCVAPLTVLAGWALGRPVGLALDGLQMAVLLGAVSLVNLLVPGGAHAGDGRRATGLKGGILCVCFLVIGIATFFAPNES